MGREAGRTKFEKLNEMVKARAKEKNIPYSVALIEIGRENPVLAAEYRQEVLNRGKATGYAYGRDPEETKKRLLEWAKQRGFEKDISFDIALSEIARENPEEYQAYREAVMRVRL